MSTSEARAAQKQAELLALRKQLDEAQRRVAQKEASGATEAFQRLVVAYQSLLQNQAGNM
ncbi:hypothetical protein WJX84_006813 [Apatococcus fuscideae]|uniref:Uncharacterized protein n=1 Tax=Apatococcus fuscideae TaxID=2026836 RepID=A0AAW1STM6_9CHLO